MKIYQNISKDEWAELCARPELENAGLSATIKKIFTAVAKRGDTALCEFTKQFDKVKLNDLLASEAEIAAADVQTPSELKRAIKIAARNIRKFHKSQLSRSTKIIETTPGVKCWREPRAIENVGLYVPGGTAPLFSTVLMLGIPAQLAGCENIVLTTPPRQDGTVDPTILFTANLVGIKKIAKVGGAQAIAALALGTKTVPKVDKIFGPGNQFVTAAKQMAQNYGVAIDMPAGPSEVMMIADETARADFVAADLLSQAEHGVDSQVVLLTTRHTFAKNVIGEVEKQLLDLPRREIAEQSLKNSLVLVVKNLNEAMEFSNLYAPEHLILSIANAPKWARQVKNAGSVFLGNFSPESAGDYASGTNHTLPTSGWAKSNSGLTMEDFYKFVSFQEVSPAGARRLAPTVTTMAEAEGLMAHKRAMEIRTSD
ncbi:MAG: histidinol dehydrogenase [Candidatus Nomurabacteria bacterium]|jgi:histidinol dehydrogenase|nr:histidinol dehydrogenase [Candidatus Nomurabacteria bacterium]